MPKVENDECLLGKEPLPSQPEEIRRKRKDKITDMITLRFGYIFCSVILYKHAWT
jgi:hypothetical protein